jgi:hypothetical protein
MPDEGLQALVEKPPSCGAEQRLPSTHDELMTTIARSNDCFPNEIFRLDFAIDEESVWATESAFVEQLARDLSARFGRGWTGSMICR